MNQRRRVKPREKKAVRIFKRTLTIVLSFCLVLIVSFGVIYNLAINQSAVDEYKETKPSLDIVSQGIETVSLGNEVFLSNSQVNNSIAYLIQNSGQQQKEPRLTGFYLKAEGEPGKVCYCVTLVMGKRTWALSGNGIVAYENGGDGSSALVFTVNSLKVGKLPLPAELALKILSSQFADNTTVSFDENRVRIATGALPIQIAGFRAADGGFYVTANGLVDMLFGASAGEEASPLQQSLKKTLQEISSKIGEAVNEEDKQKLADLERELAESYLAMQNGWQTVDAAKIAEELKSTVTGLLDDVEIDLGEIQSGLNNIISGLL